MPYESMHSHKSKHRVRKVQVGGKIRFVKDFIDGSGRVHRGLEGPFRHIRKHYLRGGAILQWTPTKWGSLGGNGPPRQVSRGDIISKLDHAFKSWRGTGVMPIR